MKIALFVNGRVGLEVSRYLLEREEDEVVALVLHPEGKRRATDPLIDASGLPPERILDGSRLQEDDAIGRLRDAAPDIGVSAFFGYILHPAVLDLFPRGCLNLHPAYLPYNRGTYPNVWSIVERTPAGATIHYMDEGVDTGDIVARREVPVEPTDTGETLYGKLERACVELFCDAWPDLRAGQIDPLPQRPGEGTSHRRRDVEAIDHIDPDRTYTARHLIDVLRARTFPPYAGAYLEEGGRRIYLRLELLTEDELDT